jgi:hypothetical protein
VCIRGCHGGRGQCFAIHLVLGICNVEQGQRKYVGAGENRLIYRGIDFEQATPSDPPPESEYEISGERTKKGVRMLFCEFTKLPMTNPLPSSKISDLVLPEDMRAVWAELEKLPTATQR